jgi:hypothetical protein
MEFAKSEKFRGFVCRACGETFPTPEQHSVADSAVFTTIIAAVRAHRCPGPPGSTKTAVQSPSNRNTANERRSEDGMDCTLERRFNR